VSPGVFSGQGGRRGLSKSVILCVRWEAGARFRCGPGIRAVVGVRPYMKTKWCSLFDTDRQTDGQRISFL